MNEQLTTEILNPWPYPGMAILYGRNGYLDHVEITSTIFVCGNTPSDILDVEYISED